MVRKARKVAVAAKGGCDLNDGRRWRSGELWWSFGHGRRGRAGGERGLGKECQLVSVAGAVTMTLGDGGRDFDDTDASTEGALAFETEDDGGEVFSAASHTHHSHSPILDR